MSIFDETPETKDFEEKVAIRKKQLEALKTNSVATKNKLLIMGQSQKLCKRCHTEPCGNYDYCLSCYMIIKRSNLKYRNYTKWRVTK